MRRGKTTSTLPPKSPESVSSLRVNGRKPNRDSDIVLDVDSLLDQLMGGDVDSLDEEETNDKKALKPTATQQSPRIKESVTSTPATKPKISDNEPVGKNTTTQSPKRSPSHTNFGEELPIYSLRSRRSVNRMEGEIKNDSEVSPKSPRKILPLTMDTSPKSITTKPEPVARPSPLRSEFKVSTEEEEQMNVRGLASRSRRSVLQNGQQNGHVDNEDEDKGDEIPHRMRARSTVISSGSGSKDRLKVRAFKDFTEDIEEQQNTAKVKESRRKTRPSSAAVGETSIGRSGSFKRRQQMDGDKALGLFYHSRHSQSQFNDLDPLDETERNASRGSSMESDPRSPTPLRPRDSHSFSPSPLPQSPLISKQQTIFDLDHKNITPSPQSPKAAAASEEKESELEVGSAWLPHTLLQ